MRQFSDWIATAIVALLMIGVAIAVGAMVSEPERYIQQPQVFSDHDIPREAPEVQARSQLG